MSSDVQTKKNDFSAWISKAALKRLVLNGYVVVSQKDFEAMAELMSLLLKENQEKDVIIDRSNVSIVQGVARIQDLQQQLSVLHAQLSEATDAGK